MAHGKFHWNELLTRDPEKAKTFLGATLGWTFEAFPVSEGTYWVAMVGGEPAGGIMKLDPQADMESMAERWMSYIEVDDVDKRLNAVTDAGGRILREPFEVSEVGRIAIIADSAGAVVGWITPVERTG